MAKLKQNPLLGESDETRFWSKVSRQSDAACWPWTAAKCHGYGHFRMPEGHYKAHRIAYLLSHGPIAAGKLVCHACDNPGCCNPSHLWVGTAADNAKDREAKGRGAMANATLTYREVEEIRRIYAMGHSSYTRLSRRFSISRYTIRDIVKRWTWTKV